ncbi:YbhN family protein [Paenibacillus tarimensis]
MKKAVVWLIGAFLIAACLILSIRYFDPALIRHYLVELTRHPIWLIGMIAAYALAFVLRAVAWKWYVGRPLPFIVCLSGLLYSLLINHIVPLKVGDGFRVYVLMKEKIGWDEALHSTLVMRTLDLLILALFAGSGAVVIGYAYSISFMSLIMLIGITVTIAAAILFRTGRLRWLNKHVSMLAKALSGTKGRSILVLIALSWILEAFVLAGVVGVLGMQLGIAQAVWANSMTIAGQTFQMTPGGIGSYESVMSFSLAQIGFTWEQAYIAAIVTHGFKFGFSYLAGLYVWFAYPLSWKEIRQLIQRKGKASHEKSVTV